MRPELGVMFSPAMVIAILDGRKTQTRRPLKPQPKHKVPDFSRARLGPVGRRLWVREGLRACFTGDRDVVSYEADGKLAHVCDVCLAVLCDCRAPIRREEKWTYERDWMPSLLMRRRFARILLEVTQIRQERLHDISEEDAWAEGVKVVLGYTARDAYLALWDSLNAKHGLGWRKNPWLWAYDFRVVEVRR
jgi:hypothetical protein